MALLAGKTYDPATAVSKITTSLQALTAFDTTNLRNIFTVPTSGIVLVRILCVMHGSATPAQVLLGVLESTTVIGRQAPIGGPIGTVAATSLITCEAAFLVTGLTGGVSKTWDAAYGVETVGAASSAIKYGGPNDSTLNNAFGGFVFEVWEA